MDRNRIFKEKKKDNLYTKLLSVSKKTKRSVTVSLIYRTYAIITGFLNVDIHCNFLFKFKIIKIKQLILMCEAKLCLALFVE